MSPTPEKLNSSKGESPTPSENPPEDQTPTQNSSTESGQTTDDSLGETSNGNVGDTEIETGDAPNTGKILTAANDNTSTGETCTDCGSGSASVVNGDNGTGSENSGSATIVDNNTTIHANSAAVTNNLEQSATTG